MSKYIIDIDDNLAFDPQFIQLVGAECTGTVRIRHIEFDTLEELNSDYINEHYGELQDEAYQRGINDGSLDVKQRVEGAYQRGLGDAWKLAEDVIYNRGNVLDILHCATVGAAFDKYSAEQALDILRTYEYKQDDRIEVGDEVVWYDDATIIVTMTYVDGGSEWCDGVSKRGRVYHVLLENVRKTGKHYDIQSILEAMRTHD